MRSAAASSSKDVRGNASVATLVAAKVITSSTVAGKHLTKNLQRLQSIRLPTFSFGSSSVCTYCGQTATSKDHVIPVAFQRLAQMERLSSNGPWTWACRWCNSTLNDRYFDTFQERTEWIHNRIEFKAAPINWFKWELEVLDYGLQKFIKSDQDFRSWLRQRADWWGSRDFLLNMENLQWGLPSPNGSPACRFLLDYFGPTVAEIKAFIYR